MKKHILAIGGGGFARNNGSLLLEKYILNLSKKDFPRIAFIPTATGDSDNYIVRFYSIFNRLKCIPSHLDFFKRTIDLSEYIMSQDIVFVGGGNTKSMLAVWRDWGMDTILKQAYNKGIIMSGVSAGAICWFSYGITDSWDNKLKLIECLNFIDGTCCPHYDEEPDRKPYVKSIIRDNNIKNCTAIEGGSALHIIDGNPYKNISFYYNKKSYNVYSENSKIIEYPLSSIQL